MIHRNINNAHNKYDNVDDKYDEVECAAECDAFLFEASISVPSSAQQRTQHDTDNDFDHLDHATIRA
jgi:hypothetical protein